MIFLKQYWHLVVISVMGFALFVLWEMYQGQRMTAESRGSILAEKEARLKYYETPDGKTVAEKEAAEAKINDILDAYPELIKQLEQMNVKMNHLRTSMQASFNAQNSGTSIILRDTIYREGKISNVVDSIQINDGYLSLKGEIDKRFSWKYSYTDTLTTALFIKKKWFLGNEKLYFTGMLQNPNAKITNATSIQVRSHRDKRWVISAGVSYDPFRDEWGASIHFGRKLFAF